ncbi:MAG: response regulator [Mitsuaria chitosanitabida]|uniref:response regulator n=1 Tax=Roseateles chitosanitabidus TaxID=65048 RepID=UPI001B26079E|nr:response regulator [Roseateles chitosanitabidus]MBO9686606.1 response regulator [Roseateles chitosanitabidus]
MNVVIVESSSTVRLQLQALLASEPRLHVVGEAADEPSAIQVIARTQPDVVLMDLALQPGSGLRVLRAVRQLGIGARVVVLSNSYYEEMRRACAEHGISGFFDKSRQTDEVLALLRSWLPPLTSGEDERQAAVDGLDVQSRVHEAFDELADLACDISGSGMAAIGLLDHEDHRLIGVSGLSVRLLPRDRGFCSHVVNEGPLIEVPDTWHDARFADHPLVQGAPYVRFYASVPLALSGGEVVGSLCVMDRLPRRLRERQREALVTLARCAVNELEALRRQPRHMEQAMSAAMTL